MSDLNRLQKFFTRWPGRTVGRPTLAKIAAPFSLTQRVSELRQMGLRIVCTTRTVKGKRRSSYRYEAA